MKPGLNSGLDSGLDSRLDKLSGINEQESLVLVSVTNYCLISLIMEMEFYSEW